MILSYLNIGGSKMSHLQAAAVKKINEICDRYVNEKTPLMMILSDIQKEYGYVPIEVQEVVSKKTGISVAEIYGVVTFYSFFSLKQDDIFSHGYGEIEALGGDISETKYDVAHLLWGENWRLPTREEFSELTLYCSWFWTSINNVYGYEITGFVPLYLSFIG